MTSYEGIVGRGQAQEGEYPIIVQVGMLIVAEIRGLGVGTCWSGRCGSCSMSSRKR
jgi:hypothetical protein